MRIEQAIAGWGFPCFAVLDGGQFDDAAGSLRALGLGARSLFLGEGSRDLQRHGPWLTVLAAAGDVGQVLAMCDGRPAAGVLGVR